MGRMKITSVTFIIGTAALCGIYPLSGFYSKDAVMVVAQNKPLLLYVGCFVAFLTSFYMTRLCVVVFFGKSRSWASEESKEVSMIMLLPLLILAFGAIFAGYPSAYQWFVNYSDLPHPKDSLPIVLSAIGLLGIFLGFFLYKGKDAEPFRIKLLSNKFYLDEIYLILVKLTQDLIAHIAKVVDRVFIDKLFVRGGARLVSEVGSKFRAMQSGNLQSYSFFFAAGVVLVLIVINSFIG